MSKPQLPLVNATRINEILNLEMNGKTGMDKFRLKGVFPRWIISGHLSVQSENNGNRSIESLVILGDTKLENELGIAPGFNQHNMTENEVIIPQSYAEYFGIGEGHEI